MTKQKDKKDSSMFYVTTTRMINGFGIGFRESSFKSMKRWSPFSLLRMCI